MYQNYTVEERTAALQTSLTDLARSLGYTPVKKGRYYSLKEMDSVIIYNDATWCRWSKMRSGEIDDRGGTQIDFMLKFGGCSSVPDAIHEILSRNHIYVLRQVEVSPKVSIPEAKEMVLPEKSEGYKYLYAYLCKTRKLSPEVVSYFTHDLGILYESKQHHNLVFLGKDNEGNVKYAMQRGTSDIYGRVFKGDVKGNDKSHGVNIVNPNSSVLKVFESSIDCMSYIDITGDIESNKLVLGMLSDRPLQTFLQEQKHIKEIWFCLDNDEPARNAVLGVDKKVYIDGTEVIQHYAGLLETYQIKGYEVKDCPAEVGKGKDYNENLKVYREQEPTRVLGMAMQKRQTRGR